MNDSIATPEPEPSIRVSAAELALTREKFAKLAARSAKRGFTGGLELQVEGPIKESRTDEYSGMTITEVFYQVRITGQPPAYEGWKFLGRVEATDSGKPIVFTAPGVEKSNFDNVRPGDCDHCGYNRRRKTTYLVVNVETGEEKNVGSSCLKDFLGWQATPVFIYEADVKETLGGWGSGEPAWTPETVVAFAWAAIKAFGGFHRSGEPGSTVGLVRAALRPFSKADRDIAAKLCPLADEATEKAQKVLEFIRSDEFAGNSSYVTNLKSLVDEAYVTGQFLGFLASAPQAWIRHLETADERAAKLALWAAEKATREADKATSQHLAKEGERLQIKGNIVSIRWQDAYVGGGSTPIYKLRTDTGHLLTYFASSPVLGETEGAEFWIYATVKKHEVYEGTKQTQITRAANMNPDTGKPFSAKQTNKHWESEWVGDERVYTHNATPHPDCENCYKVAHNIDLN